MDACLMGKGRERRRHSREFKLEAPVKPERLQLRAKRGKTSFLACNNKAKFLRAAGKANLSPQDSSP